MENAHPGRVAGTRRFLLLVIGIGAIHFGLSMLSIFNGLIIFRGPSTASEIFWEDVMMVMLFPADVIIHSVYDQWGQTIILILNSLAWGGLITLVLARWRTSRKKNSSTIK